MTARISPLPWALAFLALGCFRFREAQLTRPVAMSPMTDAVLSVELDRVLVSVDTMYSGFSENSELLVILGLRNLGREPYTLNAASISCWLELSAERPAETRALTPVAGGEGSDPSGESKLGSITIPPGETRHAWVKFGGYRYPGSNVQRKIAIWLPDARGRRVELVIADPGIGQSWEVRPLPLNFGLGVQDTTLGSSTLEGSSVAIQLVWTWRMGPLLADAGMSERLLVQTGGQLISETSAFRDSINLHAHLTVPLIRWSLLPTPWLLGIYGGGEVQFLNEITHPGSNGSVRESYRARSVEGGVEMDFSGSHPAQSPFPISFSQPSLSRWVVRIGYTQWWVSGNDVSVSSGGLVFAVRFAFL